MAISLAMWGYVAARGNLDVRDNPDAAHNAKGLDYVCTVARKIDSLPDELISQGFTTGRGTESCLKGIVFESDTDSRFGLRMIVKEMHNQGTLVIPSLDMLITRHEVSKLEIDILKNIIDGRISIIAKDDKNIKKFLNSKEINRAELNNFIKAGADRRNSVERRIQGYISQGIEGTDQDFDFSTKGFKFYKFRNGEMELVPRHYLRRFAAFKWESTDSPKQHLRKEEVVHSEERLSLFDFLKKID